MEEVHVEAEGAVVLQMQELGEDAVDVFRLAIGRQAHDLVFARIDLEAGVSGGGGSDSASRRSGRIAGCACYLTGLKFHVVVLVMGGAPMV